MQQRQQKSLFMINQKLLKKKKYFAIFEMNRAFHVSLSLSLYLLTRLQEMQTLIFTHNKKASGY